MALRANWRGFLKLADLTCPVALYTAVSTSDRIALHTLKNRNPERADLPSLPGGAVGDKGKGPAPLPLPDRARIHRRDGDGGS